MAAIAADVTVPTPGSSTRFGQSETLSDMGAQLFVTIASESSVVTMSTTAFPPVLSRMPSSGPSASAGRLGARVHFDPVEWYHTAEPVPFLPLVARAVLDDRLLTMTYESWTGLRTYRVTPLGVVLKASAWYLVAQGDDGRPRIHRVANIRVAEVLDETCVRPSAFDLAAFWRDELARFEAGLRPQQATLEVSDEARRRISRLGAYAAVACDAARANGGGGWVVDLPIESIEQGADLVLRLGTGVCVVGPIDLRARVHALATAIAARHAADDSTPAHVRV
jgi:predicted DNA-binding transcriptional regulator YafY